MDLLPGYEKEAESGGVKSWKAGDFGGDPMAHVALAAAQVNGAQAQTPVGLVGEAKRSFAEKQGLSSAAWKAMSANEELAGLFAQAAKESAKPAKRGSKRGIRGQAIEIMEAADNAGHSAVSKIKAIGERTERSNPVEAAASILSVAAQIGLPPEEQAELLRLCSQGPGKALRSFLAGCIPAVPKELAESKGSLSEAAAAIPLLAEDLQAVKAMAPAFLKGLAARHRKNIKSSVGEQDARDATIREFEDIVDCSRGMPAGFWSRLDAKDPLGHAKRIHHEWVENLAQQKAGADASMAVAWRSLVDKDAQGRASAVELLTGRALFEEGSAMRHCVSSYSSKCKEGGARIVSMRLDGARASTLELAPMDAKGQRISELDFESLEQRNRVKTWKAVQHRGKCNAQVSHPELLALAGLIEQRASAAFLAHNERMSAERKTLLETKSSMVQQEGRLGIQRRPDRF